MVSTDVDASPKKNQNIRKKSWPRESEAPSIWLRDIKGPCKNDNKKTTEATQVEERIIRFSSTRAGQGKDSRVEDALIDLLETCTATLVINKYC